jgi:hypothetical protein
MIPLRERPFAVAHRWMQGAVDTSISASRTAFQRTQPRQKTGYQLMQHAYANIICACLQKGLRSSAQPVSVLLHGRPSKGYLSLP